MLGPGLLGITVAEEDGRIGDNHINTVWRHFHGNLGEDLLRQHDQTSQTMAHSR